MVDKFNGFWTLTDMVRYVCNTGSFPITADPQYLECRFGLPLLLLLPPFREPQNPPPGWRGDMLRAGTFRQ